MILCFYICFYYLPKTYASGVRHERISVWIERLTTWITGLYFAAKQNWDMHCAGGVTESYSRATLARAVGGDMDAFPVFAAGVSRRSDGPAPAGAGPSLRQLSAVSASGAIQQLLRLGGAESVMLNGVQSGNQVINTR